MCHVPLYLQITLNNGSIFYGINCYFIYPEKYQIKERRKIEGGNNTIHFDILLLEIHFFLIYYFDIFSIKKYI